MQKIYDYLTTAFRKNRGFLSFDKFSTIIKSHCEIKEDSFLIAELLIASGYPIEEKLNGFFYKPYFTPYKKQEFAVIDIETNGSKPGYSQVIEIGGVKIKEGKIIDRLETFVKCAYIPDSIIELTGITPMDLVDAPSRKEALLMLREFLGDAIFVAHNVTFDYTFLSASFKRFGLGSIGNMRLCSLELAKKTLQSPKYGLVTLCETLNIPMASHHRAYSDAVCAAKIMLKSFQKLPSFIKSTDDLLRFAQENPKKLQKEKKQRKTKAK